MEVLLHGWHFLKCQSRLITAAADAHALADLDKQAGKDNEPTAVPSGTTSCLAIRAVLPTTALLLMLKLKLMAMSLLKLSCLLPVASPMVLVDNDLTFAAQYCDRDLHPSPTAVTS